MVKRIFSVVIPVYKNELNLSATLTYILEHLGLFMEYEMEVVMVCDGSPDRSWEVMQKLKKQYPGLLHIIKFGKNYGQKMAMMAGIAAAKGDVIGVISADLQDPFELFADMLQKWADGYKAVAGCRKKREDSFFRNVLGGAYHWFLHHCIDSRYPAGGFDFFVIDKSLKDPMAGGVLKYGNSQFLLLQLTDEIYFIPYERKKREAGQSGYALRQLLEFAVTNILINSDRLFYWMVFGGIFLCGASLLGMFIFAFCMKELYVIFVGMAFILLGICITGIGMAGVSIYQWAQNFRNLPKYRIEKEYK